MKTISLSPKIAATVTIALCAIMFLTTSAFGQSMYPWCNGKGTAPTNGGTEFLLVFMQNAPEEVSDKYQDIYIGALDQGATVTISCKAYQNEGDSTVIKLGPNQGASVPFSALHPTRQYLMTTNNEIADQLVIHVVADSPIICYGMNHKNKSADAFLAMPKEVLKLGTTYRILSFVNSNSTDIISQHKSSEFAVAAFEDSTIVTITPTCLTTTGQMPVGEGTDFMLDSLECLQIQANPEVKGDLTGSIVVANKPIAVYSGHERTEIPYRFQNSTGGTSRDHLAEAIPPTHTWGTKFIVANTNYTPEGDLMRALSDENDNVIKINGAIWCTLQAGEFRDTLISFSAGNPIDNIFAVDATKRTLVGLYCHTAESTTATYDPFFVIVPPVNQTYTDFTYFISTNSVYQTNRLLIATEQSGAGNITVTDPTGTTIKWPAQTFVKNPTPLEAQKNTFRQYSVAWLDQPIPGIWRVKTTNSIEKGIIILAYGLGELDSYGYTAGSLFRPLSAMSVSSDHRLPYPGTVELPTFSVRNIMGVPIYLDSMVMTYTSNPENIPVYGMNMHPKALGEMAGSEIKKITFTPERASSEPIIGKATIYYRTGQYSDLRPQEIDFRIEAGAMASVGTTSFSSEVLLYPNPVHHGSTELSFTLPTSATATLTIYDALGRLVATVFNGRLSDGQQSIRIPVTTYQNGAYVYDLNIPALGISKRGEFIVAQ